MTSTAREDDVRPVVNYKDRVLLLYKPARKTNDDEAAFLTHLLYIVLYAGAGIAAAGLIMCAAMVSHEKRGHNATEDQWCAGGDSLSILSSTKAKDPREGTVSTCIADKTGNCLSGSDKRVLLFTPDIKSVPTVLLGETICPDPLKWANNLKRQAVFPCKLLDGNSHGIAPVYCNTDNYVGPMFAFGLIFGLCILVPAFLSYCGGFIVCVKTFIQSRQFYWVTQRSQRLPKPHLVRFPQVNWIALGIAIVFGVAGLTMIAHSLYAIDQGVKSHASSTVGLTYCKGGANLTRLVRYDFDDGWISDSSTLSTQAAITTANGSVYFIDVIVKTPDIQVPSSDPIMKSICPNPDSWYRTLKENPTFSCIVLDKAYNASHQLAIAPQYCQLLSFTGPMISIGIVFVIIALLGVCISDPIVACSITFGHGAAHLPENCRGACSCLANAWRYCTNGVGAWLHLAFRRIKFFLCFGYVLPRQPAIEKEQELEYQEEYQDTQQPEPPSPTYSEIMNEFSGKKRSFSFSV